MEAANFFLPSIERARECRQAMDALLWSSVRDLAAETDLVPPSPTSAGSNGASATNMLDYAAYFDLAWGASGLVQVADEAKAAARRRIACRLTEADEPIPSAAAPPRISNCSASFYAAHELDQMTRWWDIEPANRMAMMAASEEDFARSCCEIGVTMQHLRDAAPELHGEVETVIRDIVMSQPDGTNLINYSGASSFALWGAFTINAETQREWLQLYRQIVHEAGHNLLFAIARDEGLIADDPSIRHASPIREDARPLDGIFHAAYVSAREALAFEALLVRQDQTGFLSEEDAAIVEDLLEISVPAFWDASETLRKHAQLTDLGARVLTDCEAYMASNFVLDEA
jgi:HEXXH motif-containing protein